METLSELKESGYSPVRKGQKLIRMACRGGWLVFEVKKVNKDGSVVLKVRGPEGEPEEKRRALAKEIVDIIKPNLEKQVGTMVEDALTLKTTAKLKKVKKGIDAGEKPELKAKKGCVFLHVGDRAVHL